jgi:hypothetical protein
MSAHLIKKFQYGNIEIGYTLAGWVILIAFSLLFHFSDGEPFKMWVSWPWWAKAMSLISPVVIFLLGGALEKSRRWPKG